MDENRAFEMEPIADEKAVGLKEIAEAPQQITWIST